MTMSNADFAVLLTAGHEKLMEHIVSYLDTNPENMMWTARTQNMLQAALPVLKELHDAKAIELTLDNLMENISHFHLDQWKSHPALSNPARMHLVAYLASVPTSPHPSHHHDYLVMQCIPAFRQGLLQL
jgi:hypothetical protein